MTNKCVRTRQRTNDLRDELIWGMNSGSELATVYYYTHRSIKGGSQFTLLGNKAWCIIAPIERYSYYRHFQWKKKELQSSMSWFCLCSTLLLITYLNAIETLIFRRKKSVIGSTSFGFAQTIRCMIFKIPYWTHSGIAFDKCHTNWLMAITAQVSFNPTPHNPDFYRPYGNIFLKLVRKNGGKGQSPALDQTLVTGENAAFSPVTRVWSRAGDWPFPPCFPGIPHISQNDGGNFLHKQRTKYLIYLLSLCICCKIPPYFLNLRSDIGNCYPQCFFFFPILTLILMIDKDLFCRLQMLFNLDMSKILSFGKGLTRSFSERILSCI